jgi:hypothetical protein
MMAGEGVAWLQIQVAGDNAYGELATDSRAMINKLTHAGTHGGRIEVCGNEQFFLGRDPELWLEHCLPRCDVNLF